MLTKNWFRRLTSALLVGVFAFLSGPTTAAEPAPLQIGVIKTLFRDTPEGVITTLSRPLIAVMESQTGMPGEWKVVSTASTVAQQLESQHLQLAVLHSFEYGWAKQANPRIRALVVANRLVRDNRFALVVRQDCTIRTTEDLKGGKLAIPVMTKEPAHLFLEVKCCENTPPAKYFQEVVATGDAEEALNSVILREVQAALVEKPALDAYLKAKPKQAGVIKVFKMSEDFPSGVLVYREGHLSDAVLQRFRTGLIGAAGNPETRDLLKLAKLAGFDPVPATFDAQVDELIKVYPAPGSR